MARKRKIRKQWLSEWHLEEHESWFEDMASKGWKIEKLNLGFATFVESEPEEIRYRIEIAPKNDEIESDRIHLYNDAGWEYVTYNNYMYVFVEREAGTAREIHTDPKIQAETIGILKKSIWGRTIPFLIVSLSIISLIITSYQNLSSHYLLSNQVLFHFIFTLLYLPLSIYWLYGTFHISSLMKRMKRGEELQHDKPYRNKLNWIRLSSVTLIVIFIASFSYWFYLEKAFGSEVRYPNIPTNELPVVSLAAIENVSLDEVTYSSINHETGNKNYYREETSFLVPEQHYLNEQFIIPDAELEAYSPYYEPLVRSKMYEARSERIAKLLQETLVEEESVNISRDQQTNPKMNGFNEVWVFEKVQYRKVIARIGKDVYDIHYLGNQSSEEILRSLAELEGK